jgi:hypothetical protein
VNPVDESEIYNRYQRLKPFLNEKMRRLYVANEAKTEGWGGVTKLSKITGLAREVISDGIAELDRGATTSVEITGQIRKKGGGRKKLVDADPGILHDLVQLLEPVTRGDPESSLLWTSKSIRRLTLELNNSGHNVSHETVRRLLISQGYSLQSNFKTIEANQHEDRNEQFEYIYKNIKESQMRRQPSISVDTKKKEIVGNYKNSGKDWSPVKEPERVNAHDFENPKLGKAIPFGVYDIAENQGWVSIGIDHDTSQFAVSSIRNWWFEMGAGVYPDAQELTITADSGGSNGHRRRLWKTELQKFADETGIVVHVLHFPPGTSKWNKIEHRMFSFISKNWRGRPLVSLEVIVSLIANTTTDTGLKINCSIDRRNYPTGIKVSDDEMNDTVLVRDEYHGDWNYRIFPHEIDNIIN